MASHSHHLPHHNSHHPHSPAHHSHHHDRRSSNLDPLRDRGTQAECHHRDQGNHRHPCHVEFETSSVSHSSSSSLRPCPTHSRPKPPSTRPPTLSHSSSPFPPTSSVTTSTGYTPPPTTTTTTTTTTTATTTTSRRPRGYPKPLGHGKGFPIVSTGRYLHGQSTTYHLRVSSESTRRHKDYAVYDHWRKLAFRVTHSSTQCLRDSKTLVDMTRSRRPVITAHHVMFSTRSRVFVRDAHDAPLLFLQKMSFVNVPKVVHGFIRSKTGGGKAHLVVTEERINGRSYVFRDRRSNEVACIERYRLSSRQSQRRRYAYRLYVSAGYDCALFTMCAALLLDMWND